MFRLYGAKRCFLCIDPTAELADLSFGDFWANANEDAFKDMTRCTLCSQRSEKGLSVLKAAQKDGAIQLYPLPDEMQHKRTSGFIKEKKVEGYIRLRRFKKKRYPVPNYHHDIPKATLQDNIAEAIRHRLTQLFRGPIVRKIFLKILFSRLGECMDRVNQLRKL
jgi:coenzyme F420-reducing hydrogenase beta subunit